MPNKSKMNDNALVLKVFVLAESASFVPYLFDYGLKLFELVQLCNQLFGLVLG